MTRERADIEGRRLVSEGRLAVTGASAWHVEATCKGDSGHCYALGYTRAGWWCDCPAPGRCSHLVAVQLVTAPRRDPGRPTHAPPLQAAYERTP